MSKKETNYIFDFYAVSKIAAERVLIESGIKHWVSVRQSFIAIPDVLSLMDPIMFHQPIEQRIEMTTRSDAGYGLVQTLEQDNDSDFWCRIYNQSGGPSCRFIFLDYIEKTMKLLGLGDFRSIMDRNWFCLRNFHDATSNKFKSQNKLAGLVKLDKICRAIDLN